MANTVPGNFTASDGHGNSTSVTCYVYVPHSQSKVVTGMTSELRG